MAVTTHFDGRVTRPRRHVPEPAAQPNPLLEGQNDLPPPPLVPSLRRHRTEPNGGVGSPNSILDLIERSVATPNPQIISL